MTPLAIILVEADPSVREAFQALAQALGFALTVFETVETAIAGARPPATDILVADLATEADIRRLLAWSGTLSARPAIILLTQQSPALLQRRLAEARDIKVLRKPVAAAELLDALNAVTDPRRGA
ncbi:DNA-binding transcriptional response regulator [Maricaulis virginensis]|jgi:DNA-binding response OmpR family regulator|uniref:Response regulatory domain-containing protein n=1 Tax=Maricaulis virginensis TaxID=144022 RepID=A0A9W6MNT9_9PROT|nr:hypothetical protein [Maricaulis virginensis]GLK52453.1 hypothetical protein GCM10017621_19610 [Maricaulis virginensis]